MAYIEDLRGNRRGEVVVAMMGGLGSDLLARSAIDYRERRPVGEAGVPSHEPGRHPGRGAGRAAPSLGLSFGMKGQVGLRSLLALDCPVGAVMSPRHALAQRKSLRLAELVSHRLILPAATMSLRPELNEALIRSGLTANPIVEANEVELMKRLAVLNQGITLLNRPNIEPERQRGDLVYVPLSDSGLPVPTLQLFELETAAPPPCCPPCSPKRSAGSWTRCISTQRPSAGLPPQNSLAAFSEAAPRGKLCSHPPPSAL